jgi:hypothetical protein
MPILVPKQIIPIIPTKKAPLLFLAGPIRGGGDWQCPMAVEILKQCQDAYVAVPSRWTTEHPLAAHFVQPFSQAENRQLVWERHYMEQASIERHRARYKSHVPAPGCLVFWLGLESQENPHPGPEPYAMDTRRELGKFTAFLALQKARVVLGGDRRFHGLDVILNEFADAANVGSFPFYERMDLLAEAALAKARA